MRCRAGPSSSFVPLIDRSLVLDGLRMIRETLFPAVSIDCTPPGDLYSRATSPLPTAIATLRRVARLARSLTGKQGAVIDPDIRFQTLIEYEAFANGLLQFLTQPIEYLPTSELTSTFSLVNYILPMLCPSLMLF